MTTSDPILAALRGETAPTTVTGAAAHDPGALLGSLNRLEVDALESAARTHVRNMIVHEGTNAIDAQAATNIDIRRAVQNAQRVGATPIQALEAARHALEAVNARHAAHPATGRPHTVAAAEAAASSWTPKLVREARQESN